MIKDFKTGLYPVSAEAGTTLFYVKSDCIKAYPASWRNVELFQGDGNTTPEQALFNVEAVLNTEYNITRKAGALRNYLDEFSGSADNPIYSFKFFINGYSFEVYNLDLREYTSPLNLYVGIRTISQEIGDTALDVTRVLAPYAAFDVTAPVYLDTQISAYYYDAKNEPPALKLPTYNKDTYVGSEIMLAKGSAEGDYCFVDTENFLFTGLVFSTQPIDTSAFNDQTIGSSSAFYSMQIIENGEFCTKLMWPNIKAGSAPGQTSVILGEVAEHSLYAPVDGMVAMGKYNSYSSTASEEDTILSIGMGNNNANRRNAFEVAGTAEDDNTQFKTQVLSGPFKIEYNDVLKAADKGTEVSGVYTLNTGIEVAEDGSHIIINRPISTDLGEEKVVTNTNIGIHAYGNINVIGSSLTFKDTHLAGETDRTIATMTVKDLVNGTTVVDRGLHMTGIGDINNGAINFRPGSVTGSYTVKGINNSGIFISDTADQIVFNTQDGMTFDKAHIKQVKKIVNTNGFDINSLTFKGQNIENLKYLKCNDPLEINTKHSIILKENSDTVRCIIEGTTDDSAAYPQIVRFKDRLITPQYAGSPNTERVKTGAELRGIQGIYRSEEDGLAYDLDDGAYIQLNTAKEKYPGKTFDIEVGGSTEIKGDLTVTGRVNFGSMDLGSNSNGELYRSIIDAVYPIGSIYMTMTPGAPFPGSETEWKRISQGRMLMGAFDDTVSVPDGYLTSISANTANKPGGSYTPELVNHNHGTSGLTGLFGSTYELIKDMTDTIGKDGKSKRVNYYFPANSFTWLLNNSDSQIDYLGYNYADRQIDGLPGWAVTDRNGNINPNVSYRLDDEVAEATQTQFLYTSYEGGHEHTGEAKTSGSHKHGVSSPYQDEWGSGSYTGCEPNAGDESADGWLGCTCDSAGSHEHELDIDAVDDHRHYIKTNHLHRTIVDFSEKATDHTAITNDLANCGNLPPFLTCYIWQRTK